MLQRLGRSVDHAPVVRLEKTMMVFIADLLQLRVGTYASIIYPSIEPAETVHDGVHNMADLFANPDVGRHVVGSAAISPDLATDVIQRFLVARDQNHLGALLRSASGRRQTDTGSAAGADDSLLIDRLEFRFPFLLPLMPGEIGIAA